MNLTDLSEKFPELLIQYGIKIIFALAIFILGRWVAKAIIKFLRRIMVKQNVDQIVVGFIANLGYIVLLSIVVIASLGQLGVKTASLVAVLGAAGLAIGLALQGSLSNFASGILLIIFRPYKAGDYIEGGGTAGTVEEVQILSTRLVTPDNKIVIVPNSLMMNDNIVNYSTKGTRRVDMVFGIGYTDDIDRARELIMEIINGDQRVHKEPVPIVAVSELADSSVNLVTRVWTNTDDYWKVYFETTEKVKKRFDAENINIPFPQRDVHVYQH
jgi:small conductance mechanosensitive channel